MVKSILINKITKSKRGQAWSLDLVIAGVIFFVGIIILYVYAINYSSNSQRDLDELFYEGRVASELILSEEDFGILSETKLNETKAAEYNSGYAIKKDRLGAIHDFYFRVDGSYFGKLNSTEVESLIQVTRITIYKNKPTKFDLFIYK